tara:strand:- start:1960 stop:2970 length:1011 start_codon:yes stop_codon:yes gene_type:complete
MGKTSKNEQKRAKTSNFFFCEKCDYSTSRKSNYDRHLISIKHLEKKGGVAQKWQKSTKKNVFKICEHCDYVASKKYNWEKHTQTIKHQQKVAKSGKKVAFMTDGKPRKNKKNQFQTSRSVPDDIKTITEQLNAIIKTQNALTHQTTINNSQHITNINNNISINVFLDQYCNDALNLQDFVENINFQLTDILSNNHLIENFLSKKLLENLKEIPLTERPIHCTDVKRKNFIVKDKNDGWVKDTVDNNDSNLYKQVNQLHTKAYIDFYNEYDKLNPLPHDVDKEQLKCRIAAELVNSQKKFNKGVLHDIAKNVDIKEVLNDYTENQLIDDSKDNKEIQ